MVHSKLGAREGARTCYDRAAELMRGREFPAAVARRAHDEARQLMGRQEQKEERAERRGRKTRPTLTPCPLRNL